MAKRKEVDYREVPGHKRFRVGDDGSFWKRDAEGEWIAGHIRYIDKGKKHATVWLGQVAGMVSFPQLMLGVFVGPKPDGATAIRVKGERDDFRPECFTWGTRAEAHNPCRKIDRKLREKIVAEYAKGGVRQTALAKRHGVSHTTIHNIVNRAKAMSRTVIGKAK